MPPVPPVTSAIPAGQRLGLRHPLQLRFLELPVLDVERLLLGKAAVRRHLRRLAHHVDRIDVELGRNACRGLVGRKGDHAHARNQVHDRIGIAHRRRICPLAALVVRLVQLAIRQHGCRDPCNEICLGFGLGSEPQHEGRDLRSQKMVGARGADGSQRLECLAADELEYFGAVVEMTHLRPARGDEAANDRHDCRRDSAPTLLTHGGHLALAEAATGGLLRGQPLARAVDHFDRGVIALLGSIAPREEAMCLEDDTAGLRVVLDELSEPETEFEAGTEPGQPADIVPVDFPGQLPAVGRRRDSNHCIRVHVIDMVAGDEAVQRRVDAGCARIHVERAVRIEPHHLVFVGRPRVLRPQAQQLVHVQRCEPVELQGPEVPAGTLDPQHFHGLAGERIDFLQLRRGIPP